MRGFTCLHALREAGYRVPKDIAYVRVSNLLQIPELDANDVTSKLSVLYDTIYTTRVLYGIIIEINQENTTTPSQKTAPIAERRSGQSGRRSTIERVNVLAKEIWNREDEFEEELLRLTPATRPSSLRFKTESAISTTSTRSCGENDLPPFLT